MSDTLREQYITILNLDDESAANFSIDELGWLVDNYELAKQANLLTRYGTLVVGSGIVDTVIAGDGVDVDATDPANPVVSATGVTQWGTAAGAKFTSDGNPNDVVTADAEGDFCVDTTTPGVWQWDDNAGYWRFITPMIGSGSPVGTVTPADYGVLYVDVDASALYFATSNTDTDWVLLAGYGDTTVVSGLNVSPDYVTLGDGLDPGASINLHRDITITDSDGDTISMSTGGVFIQATGLNGIELAGAKGQGLAVDDNGTETVVALYNTAGAVQPNAIPAPAGGAVTDVEARAAIVSILNALGAAAGGIGITK